MSGKLMRVGTVYVPVTDVERSARWYADQLDAEISYRDEDKAIANLAGQSFFLVKAAEGERSNFIDVHGEERFSLTFEVDGLDALQSVHAEFKAKGIRVGEIENRGHAGRNFVFADPDGNRFDVWSELSPAYKELIRTKSKSNA
ncbi:putative enzyme [Bhargavaea cecembensis DSE10]|uniref:Putative enzyme n=1 Tax=Bhargavaea cecembensis DSE10 TaxID=1235279 RepID=M7P9W2_9BACL|nr:VOC family protein [Bhargavaea cecembensis]EMR07259.1 putative enzyme [Bhargavaea cecembensis DSE10]